MQTLPHQPNETLGQIHCPTTSAAGIYRIYPDMTILPEGINM